MKRFWERVDVVPLDGGFCVQLDGRTVRLPGGAALAVPTHALADALAEEWRVAAGGVLQAEFRMEDMPLTRIVGTGLDRVAAHPTATVQAIAKYGETDLLCYRASEPDSLAAQQAAVWQPWLDWAARALDAPLRVTSGIVPVTQDADALAALRNAVARQSPLHIAALGVLVPALGSLVLGLAVAAGELAPENAHDAATLDDTHQEKLWGVDQEAAARRAGMRQDVLLAARMIRLLESA